MDSKKYQIFVSSTYRDLHQERDKVIETKAGHWSGYVLGFGAVSGLIHYLAFSQGSMLFYMIFGSLVISQLIEYLMQILLYRRGY